MISNRLLRRVAFAVALILVIFALKGNVRGAEVEVALASGRVFQGQLVASNSADRLAIEFGTESTSITRQLNYASLVSARLDGAEISIDQLRLVAEKLRTNRPPVKKSIRIVLDNRAEVATQRAEEKVSLVERALPAPRLMQLVIDAHMASWNGSAESDGLLVYVQPINSRGELTSTSGRIDVTLWGLEYRDLQASSFAAGQSIVPIGRWSRELQPSAWTTRGYAIRLPLGAIRPATSTKFKPLGTVVTKLVVPGDGQWEATTEVVRLRPWNPLRDVRELQSGTRLFPGETSLRGIGVVQ